MTNLAKSLIARIAKEADAHSPAHAFTVDVDPGLLPAEADTDSLEEVLRNLYENAVKYPPRGSAVVTTVATEGDSVAIRVADEGVGNAPKHVATVFERFRRVGGNGRVRGMGLGLYLRRELVDAQGGRIKASSPGPGRGATFTFALPIARGWAENEYP